MKYIFDFDDVLFDNTKKFKEHMYACLENAGIKRTDAMMHYNTMRERAFSLRQLIHTLYVFQDLPAESEEEIYDEIMSRCSEFVNQALVERVRTLGIENCIILSKSGKEFQEDKIKHSGVAGLFSEIYIVDSDSEKVAKLKEICDRIHEKDEYERVVFIDDVEDNLKKAEELKLLNLVTVHYNLELGRMPGELESDDRPGGELK